MAYLLTPSGEMFVVRPLSGCTFTQVEMQLLVGGFIDVIATASCLFIVNEAATLRRVDANYRATAALATAGAPHILFGDVVICHREELE